MEVTEKGGRLGHRVHYGDSDGIGKASSYRNFVSCRSGKLRFHRGSKRERDINTRLSARPAETRGAAGGALVPSTSPPRLHSASHSLHTIPALHTDPLLTHSPTCAVQSAIPSLCHSHILPIRTATPCPWSCWPHRCSIHTRHCALQCISAWGWTLLSLCPSWALLGVLEHTDTCPCAHSLPLACTSPSSAPPVQVLYNTAVLHSTAVVDKAKILRAGHH